MPAQLDIPEVTLELGEGLGAPPALGQEEAQLEQEIRALRADQDVAIAKNRAVLGARCWAACCVARFRLCSHIARCSLLQGSLGIPHCCAVVGHSSVHSLFVRPAALFFM